MELHVVLAVASTLLAQWFPGVVVVHPYAVESPSGCIRLEVEPGDRFGTGPSQIRLLRDGVLLFEGPLPFTLHQAAVTEDGHVVGYGNTDWRFGRGEFLVAAVAPDGSVILEERTKRLGSRGPDGPDRPTPLGLLVDPGGKWFAVRVLDPEGELGELWWRYPIGSPGQRQVIAPVRSMDSDENRRYWINDARVLPDTPWILVHWWRRHWRGPFADAMSGAVFTLVDADGTVRWRLDLLDDYTVAGDDAATDRLESTVKRVGGILEVSSPGSFALWHMKDGERVDYLAQADATGSSDGLVVEVARSPFDPEEREQQPDDLPKRRLAPVAEVPLLGQSVTSSLHDIVDFGFGADGLPVAMRREGKGCFTAVLLDGDGAVRREVPLDPVPADLADDVSLHEIGPGKWLVAARSYGEEGKSAWFTCDVATGRLHRLERFDLAQFATVPPSVEGAAGTADRGFVALCSFFFRHTMGSHLFRFDAQGRLLWEVEEDYEDPTKLFSPEDVTVLPDGTVAVLENIRNRIQLYSDDGTHRGSIDLTNSFGKEPNYPVSIHADPEGGLLIHDFHGDPTLWRLLPMGEVVARFTPCLASGHAPEALSRHARVGPDGAVWTTDGNALFVLDDQGRVARTLGAAADDLRLDQPGSVAIDSLGRTWIQDRRSGALHGFDREGRPVFVAAFAPEDAQPAQWRGRVVLRPDGGILVERSDDIYVRFDSRGQHIGRTPADDDEVHLEDDVYLRDEVYLELEGERYLTCDFHEPLHLRDATGAVIRDIEKYPDGRWTGNAADGVLAGDGRRALLAAGSVVLLDEDGAPARQIPLPRLPYFDSRISLAAGRVLVSCTDPEGLLYSFDEDRWEIVEVADKEENVTWSLGLSANGTEILAVDAKTYTLRRYALE